MNKSKPLGHAHSIDASASNYTAKLTNKSESKCNMLSELMNFASSVPDFRRADKGKHPSQTQRHHRSDENYFYELYKAHQVFMSKIKKIRFLIRI